MREVAPKALKKWGLKFQFIMLFEEMSELEQACTKYLRLMWHEPKDSVKGQDAFEDHIAEEIADVYITLYEIEQALNVEAQVNQYILQKVTRLEERIKYQ